METKDAHTNVNLAYAVQLVHATCCLAGSASYLDDIRADLKLSGITRAIRDHDTPALFDWLIEVAELSRNFGRGRFGVHGPARQPSDGRTLSKPYRDNHRARSLAVTGGSMTADIRKGPARVLSPATSTLVPCPATRCATAASTRWRTACSCSCETLRMTISWAGLIGNWGRWIPRVLIGSVPFARPSSARCGMYTGWPTRSWRWPCRTYC